MSVNQPPPPPPPPGDGYGAPPPGTPGPAPDGTPWQVGDALSFGWAKFQANVAQILLSALVLIVALGVVGAVGFGLSSLLTSEAECGISSAGEFVCTDGTGFVASLVVSALVSALMLLVALVVGAGLVRASLAVAEGRAFQFSDVIRTDKLGPVVVAALIVSALTFIGTLLCYLPGLVVGFATSYTMYFIIDRDMGAVEAIKASVQLVMANLANALVWYLVGGLVAAAGFLLCGVGALVSVPVVLLGTAYTYKRFTGQQVAA